MIAESMSGLDLKSYEYVFTYGEHDVNAESFKIIIPKMMPFINNNTIGKAGFNSHVFVNNKDDRPVISRTVEIQNYITIKKSKNCSLEHVAVNGKIPNKTRLICMCPSNMISDLTIIDA